MNHELTQILDILLSMDADVASEETLREIDLPLSRFSSQSMLTSFLSGKIKEKVTIPFNRMELVGYFEALNLAVDFDSGFSNN